MAIARFIGIFIIIILLLMMFNALGTIVMLLTFLPMVKALEAGFKALSSAADNSFA